MRSEVIAVGTEILLGQIVDTNSAYLARRLADLGIDLLHVSAVGDNLARVTAVIGQALERSELIVMTGGLGPTEDDLTREAIAGALGERPAVDPALEERLEAWFTERGQPMPARNRKQAWLIPSARALPNPHGTAPGWDVRREGKRIVAMPGVPREMVPMWEEHVEPTLGGGRTLRSRTLKLLGLGESAVEERLGDLVRSMSPTVATYAKADGVHIRLTDADRDAGLVTRRIAEMEARVRERLGGQVWGTDAETLGDVIGSGLRARGWRLAVAESLTAGDVTRALAEVEGAGDWLARGIVLPGASAADLAREVAALRPPPEARLAVPTAADGAVTVALETPDGETSTTIRFATVTEGRRRAALAALDLLRRCVGPPAS